jgi:hypothetical protein
MIGSAVGRAAQTERPLAGYVRGWAPGAAPGVVPHEAPGILYQESIMHKLIRTSIVCFGVIVAMAASPARAQSANSGLAQELVATWQRTSTNLVDIADIMPEERYDFRPTPEVRTFRERFIDTAHGTKAASEAPHAPLTKAEVIKLLTEAFQTGQTMIGSLSDAQMVESVKYPFGDRMVSRYGFWMGALLDASGHYGQLVIYLRLNGIVPPATARRSR